MADDEDEDILDSWEDADESEEFERRMDLHEKSLKENEQEEVIMSTPGTVTILKPDNPGRTDYTPQIKILKRAAVNNVKKQKPKQMTEAELKQALKTKEAEYQAARNRILGENYDETRPKLENEIHGDVKFSIIKNPNRSAPNSPSPPELPLPSNNTPPTHVVIRQPKGPDAISGFTVKR